MLFRFLINLFITFATNPVFFYLILYRWELAQQNLHGDWIWKACKITASITKVITTNQAYHKCQWQLWAISIRKPVKCHQFTWQWKDQETFTSTASSFINFTNTIREYCFSIQHYDNNGNSWWSRLRQDQELASS